ncbi:hypothetical protein [Asaia sp. As-1742]|uniref:hypothetical protein n=1 Tax=Asaia sp. As-1742 TaxID=2608325 RepID=UPI001423F599|nr:hypothetical protein [Asaia sp. As-1742]
MTRWWGPAHLHYPMTDLQSLTLSFAATVVVVGLAVFTVRAVRKHRLRVATTHVKTL